MNLKNDKDKELIDCLLTALRNARNKYVSFDDLPPCAPYNRMQDALLWLADSGFISAQYNDELSEHSGDVMFAKITAQGRAFMDNDFTIQPLDVHVTLNEEQLEYMLTMLVDKYGKKESKSVLAKFIRQFGNAGVNALATEMAKSIMDALPRVAKSLID